MFGMTIILSLFILPPLDYCRNDMCTLLHSINAYITIISLYILSIGLLSIGIIIERKEKNIIQ